MSIKKLGQGRYEVRVRTKPDPRTGRCENRKRIVKGTQADARFVEMQLAAEMPNTAKPKTLGDLIDKWIESRDLEDNTVEYYRAGARSLEAIWPIYIDKLTPMDCEDALLALPKGSVRKRARKVLSGTLKWGVRKRVLEVNPMDAVDVKDGCPPPKRDRYSPEEAARVLMAVRGDWIEPAVVLSMLCGLRREEALGLEWCDVDLKNGSVKIERAYAQVAGGATLKSTKTPGSVRTVPLAGYALDRMRELGAMRIGPVVLCGNGRPDPHNLSDRFKRLMERNGIRYVRFGNLRHTFASAAIEAGVPATTLQSLLGHASFSTTQKYVVSLGLEDAKAVRAVSDSIIRCVGFVSD